jgi:radical SAM superfamily enzyme YgiQ (UPF0313 family)
LVKAEHHAVPILEKVVKEDLAVRFHTPNALHIREINSDLADLLYRSGFHSIRLGLETADMALHDRLDGKVSEGEFERAVRALKRAGFTKDKIGVYILVGLPEQSVESVMETITLVGRTGATPYLAEYSPLPHTPLWEKAVSSSRFDLAGDPLFHNNTLLPCWDQDKRARMQELKRLVKDVRQAP